MINISFNGLDSLLRRLKDTPANLESEINYALFHSIAMVETESKRRTPLDTGLLRSSIGGAGGYSFIRGLTAGVGTNVRYAIFVHEGHGRHVVGERKFMEKGAEASMNFIEKNFKHALGNVAIKITK